MDIKSQLLTTFNSPWGRYCFIKLSFGLNQSQYFFQFYMDLHFDGISPTTNIIADDVMVHRESDEQHDRHLLQVLNKCREIGLKLNPDKCEFSQDSVQFYGNTVECQGLQPGPKKVDVIMKMPAPTFETELLSFLGMYNYLGSYIPCLSDITSTLRQLTKGKADFQRNEHYDRAFREVKFHVANVVTLKYFDPDIPIMIECDASGVGIGGTLLQNGQPMTFVSRALTSTQKIYSNIEHELLAVVLTVEHLHHYLSGQNFTIHTDHSPLVNVFKKCLNETSPRLQ